jgi:thiosulfate reductase cytochrome b subunit
MVLAPRKERRRRQRRGYASSAAFVAVHVCMKVKVKKWEKEMSRVDGWMAQIRNDKWLRLS